jgi:hypothetical protein
MTLMTRLRLLLLATTVVTLLCAGLAFEIISTQPVRGAMRTCTELFTIANRPDLSAEQRKSAARALCSSRYLRAHPIALADGGGIVGIPRNINKNFKAWREGPNVWICPTNRVGPVYQFVYANGGWRFDGPVGTLRPWGEFVRASELSEPLPE